MKSTVAVVLCILLPISHNVTSGTATCKTTLGYTVTFCKLGQEMSMVINIYLDLKEIAPPLPF